MKILSGLLILFALACSNVQDGDSVPVSESLTTNYSADDESSSKLAKFAYGGEEENNSEAQSQKIIKSARLAFEAQDIEETHAAILGHVGQLDGIVQNDNSGKGYNRLFRNMTIRIPSEHFQEFIDNISEGVSYFDQKEISRQDVSEEFVDLEARLKAKHELEKRYLELLGQAQNVKEMLEIERELSSIREEIEAKQGRLEYLKNKVSMSTVNVEFYKLTSQTGVTQSYGQKMINALKGGWDGISVFFLGILYLWPLFLIILIVLFALRRYLKRKRLKK